MSMSPGGSSEGRPSGSWSSMREALRWEYRGGLGTGLCQERSKWRKKEVVVTKGP